jgi:DNA-binding NarL/FixJ family response regulator
MCRITEAGSSDEAIAIVKDEQPHVVVIDIDMPGMDAIQTTWRIKAAAPTAQIALLTTYEDSAYRARAISAGASAYVPKYMLGKKILSTLETLLANWLEPENGAI